MSSDNVYRYTGEQFDPDLGFYYLRARYMDPAQGRFIGMDSYAGDVGSPITLHKFIYANAKPSMVVDPSGHMGLIDVMGGINIQSLGRTMSAHALRRYVKRAITQTIRDVGTARREIRKCINTTKNCRLDAPVLIVGGDRPEMAEHIFSAQMGGENNRVPAGFLHSFNARQHTSWYLGQDGCTIADQAAAVGKYGSKVDCDEFPMNSMDLGGPRNHPGFVSLKYVPAGQNRSIGAMWKQLVKASGMRAQPSKKALVVAWREIPISIPLPLK
jgi:RHS repeat-associated protein